MRCLTLAQVALNVAAFSALFLSTACAGLKAREHVLVPAMKMAWVGISSDIDVGLSLLTVDAATFVRVKQKRMAAALDAGDIPGVLMVDWSILRSTAEIGITLRLKRGEIGPGVAGSLHERIAVFTRALSKLEQGT